jgi:hypothetical protein
MEVTCSLILKEEHRLNVFENGVEGNIWNLGGGSDTRMEKTAQ